MFYADTNLTNAITTLNDFINATDVYFNTNLVSNNVIESNEVYTNYLNITNNSLFINAPTYYFILIGNYSTFEVGNTYVIMNNGINLNIDLTNYNKILKFSNNRLYYCLNIEDLTFKEIIIPENIVVKDITTGLYFIYNKTNDNGYWIQLTQSGNNHSDIVNYSGVYTNKNGEKEYTKASGDSSHAEGYNTTASGNYSHAEGYETTASGNSSHTEGDASRALGDYSHAQNNVTIADYNSMTAIGKYNISNTNEQVNNKKNKLFVIGNGTSSSSSDRQDVFIITETGDVFISGNLYINDKLYYNIGDTNWINNDYFNNLN